MRRIRNFGLNINYIRCLRGISIHELADMTGLSEPYIRKILSGNVVPSVKTMVCIVNVFDLGITESLYPIKDINDPKDTYIIQLSVLTGLLPENELRFLYDLLISVNLEGSIKDTLYSYNQYLLGQRVREFRKEKNITQKALADALNVKQSYISTLEKGYVESLSFEVLEGLCNALNVSEDQLLIDCLTRYNHTYSNETLRNFLLRETAGCELKVISKYINLVRKYTKARIGSTTRYSSCSGI